MSKAVDALTKRIDLLLDQDDPGLELPQQLKAQREELIEMERALAAPQLGAAQPPVPTQPTPAPAATPADVQEAIADALYRVRGLEGVKTVQSGTWLWARGDTKPHVAALQAAGFEFSRKQTTDESAAAGHEIGVWYWKPPTANKRKKPPRAHTRAYIAGRYGEQEV